MTDVIRTEGAESALELPEEDTGPESITAVSEAAEASGAAPVEPEAAMEIAEPVAPAAIPEESQADLMQSSDDYSQSFPSLNEGDVVQGTVVHIDREGVLVDVGTKSEGIIRRNELSRDTSIPAEDIVKVGERISVYVMEAENQDGNLILSKKRADFEKAWERVQEAKEKNETINAMVTDRVKGGLVVDLGIRGFVPASHVGNGSMKNNLERYVGQSIPLKVIEVDKERRKVVLSNKMAADEDRQSKKAETISSLEADQIRHGVVRRITNYGAFIDLGGIDGLLHISEMSWTRINHPSEVLKEGQELDVMILKMDLEAGRVSLGLRQILPDPWTGIDEKYHVGDVINGAVSRIVPFGAFVQVEGGIEGIIPNSELTSRKGAKAPVLEQGTEVEVKVIDVRPNERKMTLSLRQAKQEQEVAKERQEVEEYQSQKTEEEPRYTIGDAFRAAQQADEGDISEDAPAESSAIPEVDQVAEHIEE
jgi:ribosomal protein S1